jgi:hypothetical protein
MGDAVAFILGPYVVPDVTSNSTSFQNNSLVPGSYIEDVKTRNVFNKPMFILPLAHDRIKIFFKRLLTWPHACSY